MIRLAVKVILLLRNKDITTDQLMKTLPHLRAVWSNLIDFCEMSFAYFLSSATARVTNPSRYDPAELAKNSKSLADFFVELLQQHITDKSVTMIQETLKVPILSPFLVYDFVLLIYSMQPKNRSWTSCSKAMMAKSIRKSLKELSEELGSSFSRMPRSRFRQL